MADRSCGRDRRRFYRRRSVAPWENLELSLMNPNDSLLVVYLSWEKENLE